ncbi:protein rolling stone [Megalops cyprinoides]|uniref:protein rolling stone n=1 Tax=Megalops cyprinoides TaxID=118141 RepID=UPI001864A751|nr:protein rolling stone [Megalops cyprinoides]
MVAYYLVAFCNLVWAFCLVRPFCKSHLETSSQENHKAQEHEQRGVRWRHSRTRSSSPPGGSPEEDGHESTACFPFSASLAISLQLQWFLHILMGSFAFVVTFLYWAINYPASRTPLYAHDISLHGGNTLQVLLDYALAATPVCLSHYLFLLLVNGLYILFTIIYSLAGFTNHIGKPYIYSVLDFGGRPLVASMFALGICLGLLPFFHFLLWNLHLLRMHLAACLKGGRLALQREAWWWGGVGGRPSPIPVPCINASTSVFAVTGGSGGACTQSPPSPATHAKHTVTSPL